MSLVPPGNAFLGRPFIRIDRLQDNLSCAIVSHAERIHVCGKIGRIMAARVLAFILLGTYWSTAWAADPPCDKYPLAKQATCAAIWKSLNQEDGPVIAQFGLDQLKRREEGKINAEQHLGENMAFIKQSTEKRLERLRSRMEKE
jgi:hypothetical protein